MPANKNNVRIDRDKLLMAMARRCMNQTDLTIAAGLSEMVVRSILSGRSTRPATLGRIAKALDVDPAELLEGGERT